MIPPTGSFHFSLPACLFRFSLLINFPLLLLTPNLHLKRGLEITIDRLGYTRLGSFGRRSFSDEVCMFLLPVLRQCWEPPRLTQGLGARVLKATRASPRNGDHTMSRVTLPAGSQNQRYLLTP